jgi:hypothetical protein
MSDIGTVEVRDRPRYDGRREDFDWAAFKSNRGEHMIRFLFRFFGILLLALAFIFVVYDGMKSIADHMFYATKISQFWTEINGHSLLLLRQSVEGYGTSAAWRWVVAPILDQPIALVFGLLSVILILMGRKKRPLIGYVRD